MTNTTPACNCLTAEDASLPHAARCAAFADRDAFTGGALDTTDIRELAELAANSDIDTALVILRSYRTRAARAAEHVEHCAANTCCITATR